MTDEVRIWYSTVAFQVQSLFPGGYTERRLPADFFDLIQANFRRMGLNEIRRRTGINEVQAGRSLKRIKEKFISNTDGTLSLASTISIDEKKLIDCLANTMIVRPAFDDRMLFDHFCESLRMNNLLEHTEIESLRSYFSVVSLFAISVMHNCELQPLPQQQSSQLHATVLRDNVVVLSPACTTRPDTGETVNIAQAIFSTELAAAEHCESELLNRPDAWKFALEVTANRKLGLIR